MSSEDDHVLSDGNAADLDYHDEPEEYGPVETAKDLLGQWKSWLVVAGSLALVAFAYGANDPAPPGYVPIFALVALAALAVGIERMNAAPNPIRWLWSY